MLVLRFRLEGAGLDCSLLPLTCILARSRVFLNVQNSEYMPPVIKQQLSTPSVSNLQSMLALDTLSIVNCCLAVPLSNYLLVTVT
jgi:hypothetical protein